MCNFPEFIVPYKHDPSGISRQGKLKTKVMVAWRILEKFIGFLGVLHNMEIANILGPRLAQILHGIL